MLNETIKHFRKQKGLSQEELAAQLNVVRQTVSKWEQGLSVPDADMLLALAEVFDTKVSVLLGEQEADQADYDALAAIAAKLEVVNSQLIKRERQRRRVWHILFIVLAVGIFLLLAYVAAAAGTILFAASFPVDASTGIIGGADGPTAIFVTRKLVPGAFFFVLSVLGLAGSVIGIIKTRSK